ncbi:hypothetical protein J7K19_11995 [bacterium]|nr:hypothetical protein [bacterium]
MDVYTTNLDRAVGGNHREESLDYQGNPIKTRHRIRRRRLCSLIQDLICLAAGLIRHAGKILK